MSAGIIFLDFDGVIASPRAYTAQRDRWSGSEHSAFRWADPVACDFVLMLCRDHGARIVVSSTWRFMDERCRKVLGRYDLLPHLHDDWRTGEDPKRFRGNEIEAWLAANGRPPFIILDDDTDFLPDQLPFHVKTDSVEGMMVKDWQFADALLKSFIS